VSKIALLDMGTPTAVPYPRRPATARILTFCPSQTRVPDLPLPDCLPCRTVSADPSLHEECFKGAKFLLRLLESIGCEVKLSQVGRQAATSLYGCPDQPAPARCMHNRLQLLLKWLV
jgi:hypothetical protein